MHAHGAVRRRPGDGSGPAGAAAAESEADIFRKRGLLGAWAVDCASPPSLANPHGVYRLVDGDRVQRPTSVAPGKILDLSIIDSVEEVGPSEIAVAWQTGEGGITHRIRLREGWLQVVESTRSSGQKLVVKGRRVRDSAEAPRFVRCTNGRSTGTDGGSAGGAGA